MRFEFVRPLLPMLALGVLFAIRTPSAPPEARNEPSLARAVEKALLQQGWIGEARDVAWVEPPLGPSFGPISHPRAVLRAHRREELSDILLVRTNVSPEGRLLGIADISNLSDTAAVDETDLTVEGKRVAWAVRVDDETKAIHLADLTGVDLNGKDDFTWLERLQLHLTWFQETGQFAGVRKREYRIEPPAKQVSLGFEGPILVARIDDIVTRVSLDTKVPEHARLTEVSDAIGSPGNLVTWAVDRVRALPGFGNDRMQIAKSIAFDTLDRLERIRGSITKDNGTSTLADELGQAIENNTIQQTDPETGWPPPPMKPVLGEGIEHEGQWIELNRDPFVTMREGVPSPFLFSFVRTDRERQYTKVFIVLWDPRHIELHTMSGTREPKTATGETGPGQVPRNPETIANLVGAFNGGFQATHGEFGMMADEIVYLPPKPYAATVAQLSDGSTGFGTWPENDSIPESITSFRQNLTPLLMDDKENPYHRTWWGGVPPGWEDAARTVRTGLCLTRERFVAYFYGSSIDATHLASAMRAASCQYGLQLDMNPGHTGFEFYRVGLKGSLPELGRKLDAQSEARGEVSGASGFEFMSRRMIRYMNLMHFPRYIRTESRDFFYLTDRRLLPLEPIKLRLDAAEPGEGIWQTKGLPQQGWPPAIATNWFRPDRAHPSVRMTFVAFDSKWLRLESKCDQTSPIILGIDRNAQSSKSTSLWYYHGEWRLQQDSPASDARRIVSGMAAASQPEAPVAALGLVHGNIWVYAALSGRIEVRNTIELLSSVLKEMGGEVQLYFGQPIDIRPGSTSARMPNATCFERQVGPGGIRIFEETPVTSPKVWMPLQEKRVRYKKQQRSSPQSPNMNGTNEPSERRESRDPATGEATL